MQVEKLGLGWCKVGAEEGARSLADLLMFNTKLRSVDLRGNELGDAGAAQICRALKEHSNEGLFELDLGYNEIKDDGACFLAQVSFPVMSSFGLEAWERHLAESNAWSLRL